MDETERELPAVTEPRSHREPAALASKLARLHADHLAPLTRFVEALRVEHGGGESVPWFDPADAGVHARILILLEAPGPRATGPGGPRPASAGSGFISLDNDDQSAHNLFELVRASGIDRRRELLVWNVVGWYVGDGRRIRPVNTADMDAARESLRSLIRLLRDLQVVVLLGRKAEVAWRRAGIGSNARMLTAPHPSPLALNGRPQRRAALLDSLIQARRLAAITSG